jgi:hypothetical protein
MDYLPYYRTYKIEYTKDECIYDILNKINAIEPFSYDIKENCMMNINHSFILADTLINDIVEKLGTELTIEPVSLYRATMDLVINSKDYSDKLALFDEYLTPMQKENFKEKYKLEYYASHSMIVNKDYIGDHCLLVADEIITNNPKLEKEVLEIITNNDTGILYHTTLQKRLFINRYDVEEVYKKLLSKITKYKNLKLDKKEKSDLPENLEISQYFKGFIVGLYNSEGCIYRKLIKQSRATYVHLDSRRNDLALNSQLINKEFSLKIAGEILLEAKDKSVDFLIVQNKEDLAVFDGMQSQIVRVVNRDINLPIITEEQYVMLLEGEKDIKKLGFDKHKINVSFMGER